MNAIELAECFELCAVDHKPEGWPAIQQDTLNKAAAMLRKQHEAIKTLRDALAEPAVEPFGYFRAEPFGWADCAPTDEGAKALYEVPLLVDPAVEPVAHINSNGVVHAVGYPWEAGEVLTPLYASPTPPAEVPMLRDAEIDECDEAARTSFRQYKSKVRGQQITPQDGFEWHFARAIESAVRRKAGL